MRLGRTSFGRRPQRRALPASLRGKRAWFSWGSPPPKHADGARDARGHQVHETDHEHAEDRPRRGLRDLVGDVRDELDEQRAVESPADRGEAAHHDADEKHDRKEHAEAVGGDELHGERAEGARDAGEHGRYAERERLVERVVDAHRLGRDVLIADRDQGAPDAAAQQVPAEHKHDERHPQSEEVQPPVRLQRNSERGFGFGDDDALHAAGPLLELMVLQQLRHRHAEREGGEGEVKPLQAQRRQPEEEPGDEADAARGGHHRPVGRARLVDEDRGAVGAQGVEGAVPEGDLAVVAGEDVEPEQRDRVNQHQRELESAIAAHHERQRAGNDDERAEKKRPCAHTRVTYTLPKKPEGFTSSTATMSTSATASFSSLPMTNAPSTFSSTPTAKPPSTAPPGLSMPPSSAAANA